MSNLNYTPPQAAALLIKSQCMQLQNQQNLLIAQAMRLQGLIANGIAAQGDNPAVSAADLSLAIGDDLINLTNFLSAFTS